MDRDISGITRLQHARNVAPIVAPNNSFTLGASFSNIVLLLMSYSHSTRPSDVSSTENTSFNGNISFLSTL